MSFIKSLCQFFSDLITGDPDDRKTKPAPVQDIADNTDVEEIISRPVPPARINLEYPLAKQTRGMVARGKYPKGYPEGAVIHYNAGMFEAASFITYMRKQGYMTFAIDRNGTVYQDFNLDEWGYHAGRSEWGDIKGTVNNRFVGIEVFSAGLLNKEPHGFSSYWGLPIRVDQVRCSAGEENIAKGCYHAFTDTQINSLNNLLLWLESNGQGVFSLDLVVGHDEVSPGRKQDPGAALPFTMPSYRKYLKYLRSK